MKRPGQLRIGISNIVLPGNKKSFPAAFQEQSRLHYYASIFNTVEVNASFYKTPLFSTYQRWAKDVPDNFQFSLKLSKEITHAKNLQGDLSFVASFMAAAGGLANKKGCLLIQFPGKITLDYYEKVEVILKQVQLMDPKNLWRKSVEFRDASWYVSETRELLEHYHATLILHDFAKAKNFNRLGNPRFVYVRFHGPEGDYRGSYSEQFLQARAKIIKGWLGEGKDVYIYFNNTIGAAFENALALKALFNE